MFKSRLLRGLLVPGLLAFVWLIVISWPNDGPTARLVGAALAGLSLLLAIALIAPRRARWALRAAAGVIGAAYVVYFVDEVRRLLGGESRPMQGGQPSVTMAGIGLLVYAVPMLIYALSGYPGRRWDGFGAFMRDEGTDSDEPQAR